jgi:hypothetical protein
MAAVALWQSDGAIWRKPDIRLADCTRGTIAQLMGRNITVGMISEKKLKDEALLPHLVLSSGSHGFRCGSGQRY